MSAAVGPKLPAPANPPPDGKKARRTRERYHGTVLKSVENRKWLVYWDKVQKCATHSGNTLKFEGPVDASFASLNITSIISRCNVGDQNGLDIVSAGLVVRQAANALGITQATSIAPAPTISPDTATNSASTTTAQVVPTIVGTTTSGCPASAPTPVVAAAAMPEVPPALATGAAGDAPNATTTSTTGNASTIVSENQESYYDMDNDPIEERYDPQHDP